MRLRRSIVLWACLWALGACAGGRVQLDARLSYVEPAPGRQDGRVYYFVPEEIDLARPAPLLVFLHGGDAHTPDTAPEQYFRGVSAFKEAPFIVAAPSAPPASDGSRWCHAGVSKLIVATIAAAERQFKIDSDRVFLGGHSMGGFGAFHLGQILADRLAGVWCSSGAWWEADFRAFLGTPVYLQHGALDCSIRPDCVFAPGCPRRDHWTGPSFARAAHALMTQCAVVHVYDEFAGGHFLAAPAAEAAMRRFFAWSRQQRRNPYARRTALLTLTGSAHPDVEPMRRARWLEILETDPTTDVAVDRIVLKGPDVVRTDVELKDQTYELVRAFRDNSARLIAENLGNNRFRVEALGVKAFRIYLAMEMGDLTRPFTVEVIGGACRELKANPIAREGDYSAALDWSFAAD